MIAGGAGKVYAAGDSILAEYDSDIYVAALANLCKEISPNILLLGHTVIGRDLAPRKR